MHKTLLIVMIFCVLALSETAFSSRYSVGNQLSDGRCGTGGDCSFGQRAEVPSLREKLPAQYRGLVRRCKLALVDATFVETEACVKRHIAAYRAVQRYPARFSEEVVMCRGRRSGHGPTDVEACIVERSDNGEYAAAAVSRGLPRPSVL